MLARHSATYLFARGTPALVNFAAIAVFTRVLSPEDYGRYAVAIAWMFLLSTLTFDWLRMSTLRFYPANRNREAVLLSTVLFTFIALVGVTSALVVLFVLIFRSGTDVTLPIIVAVLCCLHGFHELSTELARARLRPTTYGLMALFRSTMALTLGTALALAGWGGDGLLIGLAVTLTVSAAWSRLRQWAGAAPSLVDRALVTELARYGLPLTASLALHYVMSMSDRLLIDHLLGAAEAGVYAVAYDLPRQSLGTLMMIVTLAGLPLAVRRMEDAGIDSARVQLQLNGGLLLAIALPAMIGLAVLAKPISAIILGSDFSEYAARLIPLVAGGVFLHGLKAYYVDHAFILTKRIGGQVAAAGAGAATNIGLNLVLLPRIGLIGAAYATVAAYAVALGVSLVLARAHFPLGLPTDTGKVATSAALMGAVLLLLPDATGVWGLAAQIAVGGCAFGAVAVLLNAGHAQERLRGAVSTYGDWRRANKASSHE